MKNIREEIVSLLQNAIKEVSGEAQEVILDQSLNPIHGDYTSNIALIIAAKTKQNPQELARKLKEHIPSSNYIAKIEVAGPGFLNFYLSHDFLITTINQLLTQDNKVVKTTKTPLRQACLPARQGFAGQGKRILIEYAHPNTHKEMHIGHMRTLITGEALARVFQGAGAKVFRANYQGDIGPHVAKALYGIQRLIEDRGISLSEIESWDNTKKSHFLGEGYVRGNQEYEDKKQEIDILNSTLYHLVLNPSEREVNQENHALWELYETTRTWSLDYYEDFYKRFYTRFDQLFFEKDMVKSGKDIVLKYVGPVFTKDQGAIVFKGEKYGFHTRVFITKDANPTYEGKDMGNAFAEHKAFPFDLKFHVVASEQAGYFQVVFKALELIDPEKFKDKQYHLSMGMVQLSDRKMSSRTGDIITVDGLLDQIREKVEELMREGRLNPEEKEKTIEQIVIGAVKYSVLKVGTGQNVAFDIEKSVSLDGDSGPYLQYTVVRTQSILRKDEAIMKQFELKNANILQEKEEQEILRLLVKFDDVVVKSAENYAPSILCNYLFELAHSFNLFYQKHKILESEQKNERLALTAAVGKTLQQGLMLLGIETPEKM